MFYIFYFIFYLQVSSSAASVAIPSTVQSSDIIEKLITKLNEIKSEKELTTEQKIWYVDLIDKYQQLKEFRKDLLSKKRAVVL